MTVLSLRGMQLGIPTMRIASVISTPAPENTVAPAITGTAQVDEVLTISLGTWLNVTALAAELRYLSDDTVVDTYTEDGTYTPEAADVGEQLYLHVVPDANEAYAEDSAATSAIIPATFTDDFTRADGAAGNDWSAGAIVSNRLVITPTLGSEVLANGDFSTGSSGSNPSGWTISGESGSDPDASIVAPNGSAGTGALKLFSSATAVNPICRNNNTLTANVLYRLGLEVTARTSGTCVMGIFGESAYAEFTTLGVKSASRWVTGTVYQTNGRFAPTNFVIDNCTAKPITVTSALAYRTQSTGNAYAEVGMQIATLNAGGVALRLDDSNLVIAYFDRFDNRVYLDKITSGTRANVTSAAATYSANAVLRLTREGDNFRVGYGGSEAIANQAITGFASAADWGIWSTIEASSFDDYTWSPF